MVCVSLRRVPTYVSVSLSVSLRRVRRLEPPRLAYCRCSRNRLKRRLLQSIILSLSLIAVNGIDCHALRLSLSTVIEPVISNHSSLQECTVTHRSIKFKQGPVGHRRYIVLRCAQVRQHLFSVLSRRLLSLARSPRRADRRAHFVKEIRYSPEKIERIMRHFVRYPASADICTLGLF